ncbi:MAG: alpha/beta fold hydrolase [Alphaproteobacteria bacterium]
MPESIPCPTDPRILPRGDGAAIAYHKIAGSTPGVVFVHGLVSDMTGGKALALEAYCRERGLSFVRFDCFGHGRSSGDFLDGTVGRWAEDTVAVLDELTEGPQVVVGSSMGGWVMLLAALARPERIAGLVGVAAAADFTEDLMWAKFTPDQRRELQEAGRIELPNDTPGEPPYRVSLGLIEEGRKRLLLRGPMEIRCPVRLIHGLEDADVPWRTSLRIQEKIVSDDVEVTLVKGGGHRLSGPADLARMLRVVEGVLGSCRLLSERTA